MAFQHYSLTLSGSAQNLGAVLASTLPPQTPVEFLTLQAAGGNSGIIYVGGTNSTITSSVYAFRIEIPVSTVPSAPVFFENAKVGTIYLKDFYVLGTSNDVLKIGIVPFI